MRSRNNAADNKETQLIAEQVFNLLLIISVQEKQNLTTWLFLLI